MLEDLRTRLTGSAPLAWPPPSDARYDPLVVDTERGVVMTLDEASVATDLTTDAPPEDHSRADGLKDFSLDAFQPEPSRVRSRAREREETRRLIGNRRPWPLITSGRLIALALVVLAIGQATLIVFMLRQRTQPQAATAPQVAPVPAPAPPAPPVVAAESPTPRLDAPETPPAVASVPRRLLVQTTPPGAVVTVDGQRRGTSPLTIEGLAEGRHQVRVGSGGVVVDNAVDIGPTATTTSLVVPMALSGWVDVRTPIPLDVLERGKPIGTSSHGPLTLSAGMHTLQFRNQAIGYTGFMSVKVTAEQLTRIAPTLPEGVLQLNATPWAHVWVDGKPVGDTPLGTLKASLGPHQVRFVHPDYGEQVRDVVVSASGPTRVTADLRAGSRALPTPQ